ncbi:MAG: hypothetical protein ACFWUE_07160 [Xylanivirga thermophila]|jgi:hypothetical protein|uniref:hypothetical protein n=1 Tax=Xylanivirga thermophila TaxID=2496273 RepID=UPI00101D6887|nr:hypothetical protein [Xylanivirga thermophila]
MGKDLFEKSTNEFEGCNIKPECILVDKVFDACYYRECQPEKIIDLPKGEEIFDEPKIIYGPGCILDESLSIVPSKENISRVRFKFRVPFEIMFSNKNTNSEKITTISDYIEFSKYIEMFIPYTSKEFSFSIRIETRSETLQCKLLEDKLVLGIGVFLIVKVVGTVELLVQAFGYSPAPREGVDIKPDNIYSVFKNKPLPSFNPPDMDFLN